MEHVCSKQIAMCKKTRNKDNTVCYIELGNNPINNNKIFNEALFNLYTLCLVN